MSNLEKYNKIFMEVFNVDAADLDDNFAFKSVDSWDSMAHMALVSSIEDSFCIFLDTEDILNITSYPNGKSTLAKYDIIV